MPELSNIQSQLVSRFDERVTPREGGVSVAPASLTAVAAFLKNESSPRFDFLDMITAVDYPTYFELVYTFFATDSKEPLRLFSRIDTKVEPVIDSVYSIWNGADFQEREVFDLFGIQFRGHPNLKRIVLWEGFNGHPLRKDFTHDA